MATPPRLKELARALKLSVPTVSLALRNAGNVSARTCLRVQQAATAMGYRPDPYAAALSAGRQPNDAHGMPLAILRWQVEGGGFYPMEPIVEGIERRGAQLGYHVRQCRLASTRELSQCLRRLYHQGVQGIFIAPIGDLNPRDAGWANFCVLACGRYYLRTPFHTVRSEIFESTRTLALRVIERGYRRVGAAIYYHDPPALDDFARLSALRCAVTSHWATKRDDPVRLLKFGEDCRWAEWVRARRLDAVIIFAAYKCHELSAQGLRVPEELGVACLHYDGGPSCQHVSGVMQQNFEIGLAAANQMDFMIRHRERGIPAVPQQIVIEGKWMEGATLPVKTPKRAPRGRAGGSRGHPSSAAAASLASRSMGA